MIRPARPLPAKNVILLYPTEKESSFFKDLKKAKKTDISAINVVRSKKEEILKQIRDANTKKDLDAIDLKESLRVPTLESISKASETFINSNEFISNTDLNKIYNDCNNFLAKLKTIESITVNMIDTEIKNIFGKNSGQLLSDTTFINIRTKIADSLLAILLHEQSSSKKEQIFLVSRVYGVIDWIARNDASLEDLQPEAIQKILEEILIYPISLPIFEFTSFRPPDYNLIVKSAYELKKLEFIEAERKDLQDGLNELESLSEDELESDPPTVGGVERAKLGTFKETKSIKKDKFNKFSSTFTRTILTDTFSPKPLPSTPTPTPTPIIPLLESKKIIEKEIGKRDYQLSSSYLDPAFMQNIISSDILSSTRSDFAIGFTDLMLVQQKIKKYVPGEIAHIENILVDESKKRTHRDLNRLEQFYGIEREESKTNENELSTTDRFEISRETQDVLSQQSETNYSLSASYGATVEINTEAGKTSSQAKEQSNQISETYAKETINKAIETISNKVKETRETRSVKEVEIINEHNIDNKSLGQNIRGIYQWLDKYYDAQLIKYDKRLIFEFIIPKPAVFLLSKPPDEKNVNLIPPMPPKFHSMSIGEGPKSQDLQPKNLSIGNYGNYASKYMAEIPPPLPQRKSISVTHEKHFEERIESFVFTEDVAIEDGYYLESADFSLSIRDDKLHDDGSSSDSPNHFSKIIITIGNQTFDFPFPFPGSDEHNQLFISVSSRFEFREDDFTSKVPVSVIATGIDQATITISMGCKITKDKFREWQIKAFDAIMKAYKRKLQEYEEKLLAREIDMQKNEKFSPSIGRNPGINEQIIKTELKKLCISMLREDNFENWSGTYSYDQNKIPQMNFVEAIKRKKLVQFFEQAFEWDQISYRFYPYFWGDKETWYESIKLTDNDDRFEEFLKSGAARINVPVRPFYEEALLHFQSTTEPPSDYKIIDPLYVPLIEEIKELHGAAFEGEVVATWEHKVPTSLIYLKDDGVLPTTFE